MFVEVVSLGTVVDDETIIFLLVLTWDVTLACIYIYGLCNMANGVMI